MIIFSEFAEGITKPVSMSVIDNALSSSESKIVGKDLKPRALSREIEKSVGKKFGIEVTFKFVPSLTKDDMSANAYYDQEDDIEGDPSITIELLMSAENRNGINIDSKGFDALTFNLSKVIAHEMLHKSQASNRGFVKPFKVSFTDPKQEYLGRSDEIEAYAHNIAVDLLRNYGSRKDVLSYFIGGNSAPPHDQGFAIKPWKKITFSNSNIIKRDNIILTMGMYTFEDLNNTILEVEYTFIYELDNNNQLKIILHHSSVPFK